MEPARLRAMLARTPGLMAAHLKAACPGPGFRPGCCTPLLAPGAAARAPARWLEHPDERLIDSDLRWCQASEVRILCLPGWRLPPQRWRLCAWHPAALYVSGHPAAAPGPRGWPSSARARPRPPGRDGPALRRRNWRPRVWASSAAWREGIATAALEGALAAGGRAIGVCATGLGPSPARPQARLAAPDPRARQPDQPVRARQRAPRRHHFPLRDRLLSVRWVRHAGGGSPDRQRCLSVTAAQELRRQRRVFAVPGSIRDPAGRAGAIS